MRIHPLCFVAILTLATGSAFAQGTVPKIAKPEPGFFPRKTNPNITSANIGQTICKKGYGLSHGSATGTRRSRTPWRIVFMPWSVTVRFRWSRRKTLSPGTGWPRIGRTWKETRPQVVNAGEHRRQVVFYGVGGALAKRRCPEPAIVIV